MKVLLIGGAGFIGTYLAEVLSSRDDEVEVVDCFEKDPDITQGEFESIVQWRAQYPLKNVYCHTATFDEWAKNFSTESYDVIVHLAALPVEKFEDPDVCRRQLLEDMPLTYHVIEKMKQDQSKARLVYMSSLFAYGSFDWSANENQALKPITAYGIGKATGEFMIKMSGLPYNIIRTTSVYGFGDQHQRATKIFLNKAMNGEEFWVNSNSWPDFIYIKDLAMGIMQVIESEHINEDFHISGGMCLPLEGFAARIRGHYPNLKYTLKSIDDRPRRGSLDNTKARMLLNWQPKYSLDEGVAEYVAEAKAHGFA